jgi:hypothetical protein
MEISRGCDWLMAIESPILYPIGFDRIQSPTRPNASSLDLPPYRISLQIHLLFVNVGEQARTYLTAELVPAGTCREDGAVNFFQVSSSF